MQAKRIVESTITVPANGSAKIPDGWVVTGGWKLGEQSGQPGALYLTIRKESEGEISKLKATVAELRQRHRQQVDMNQELSARLDYALSDDECACDCNDQVDADPLENLLTRVAIIEKFLWGSSNG